MSRLPDYEDALVAAVRAIEPVAGQDTVDLADAAGRVLAEPVIADRDLPPFNRAQLDGYALRAADFLPGHDWRVVATIPAGDPAAVNVPSGCCVAIATGAPLPPDLDTVIQHELSDRGNPVRFTVESISAGHAVHPHGADARRGDTLVSEGTLLAAHHLGIAASVGRQSLPVRRRPAAAILTSGDEVVETTGPLESHQIRNSNLPMVTQLLRRFGADPIRAAHLPDERGVTDRAVEDAVSGCDLLITVGGISAGERDHFPAAFAHHGISSRLHGAAIQPGRPIFVGVHASGTIVVGLPGNPVSVLVCACLFVWPIVRIQSGIGPALPWQEVTLAEPVKPNPKRRAFRPAIVAADDRVRVPPWRGSGDLAHTAPTDGLVELPVQDEPVEAGAVLRFLAWP